MENKQVRDKNLMLPNGEELRRRQLQLEAILNNIPDIAWLKDKESRFICVNEPFGRACGVAPAELVGKTDLDIWPKDLAERYRTDDREVMESGKRICVDEPLADREGKIKWIETIKTPIYSDKGGIIGTTGIARDITERKILEDKLRQAQAELEIRVKVRTAELANINEELEREILQRRSTEKRLSEINDCLLNFTADPMKNIESLTALCGKLLGADCALYNRLTEGMLCSWGCWNTPEDFKHADNPEGHICYDVIKGSSDEPLVTRDLQNSKYALTDPSVKKYGLKTYIGQAVMFGESYVGSLCVLYKHDFLASRDDKKILGIVASAIAVEERRRDALEALQGSESRYRTIFEGVPVSIWEEDFSKVIKLLDGIRSRGVKDFRRYFTEHPQDLKKAASLVKILNVNAAGLKIYGARTKKELFASLERVFTEESYPVFAAELAAIAEGKDYFESECVNKRLDGKNLVMIIRMEIPSDRSKFDRLIVALADITDRKSGEEALRKSEQEKSIILDSTEDLIVYHGLDMKIIWANKASGESLSMRPEELAGRYCWELWHQRKSRCPDCPVARSLETGRPERGEVTSPDGRFWFIQGYPVRNPAGKIEGVVELCADITERKLAEAEKERLNTELVKSNDSLKKLSLTDSHTGLFNHRYLTEMIEAEFHRAKRFAYPLAVIMLDIDYFKSINDVYGHQFGDLVLKQFAGQLKKTVRRYDIVVRYGGEEFIIVSPSIDRQQALILAHRLLDAMNLYNFGDKKHSVKLKLSLAVSTFPEDKIAKGMDLVNIADKILAKAKESGGNKVFTSEDGIVREEERIDIRMLKGKIEKLTKRANQSLVEAILAFAKTIELKDHYTGEHVENTVFFATEIAKAMGLSREEVDVVKEAAMLHDLGKIGISENILLKRSRLTKKEFEEIKKHPQIGADILRPIHFLQPIIPLVLYHHERWDGKGYPSGIKGEEIPVGARIIAIADVYQALTSDRPYRKAFSKASAIRIIQDGSGTQFDPQIAAIFIKILRKQN